MSERASERASERGRELKLPATVPKPPPFRHHNSHSRQLLVPAYNLFADRLHSPTFYKLEQSPQNQIAAMQGIWHTFFDHYANKLAPIKTNSTFRSTGQITPEEFVHAGDFLVYKFPSWSWSDASHPSKRVSYLPEGKQFLVTRGVPCHRRLDENFAGEAGHDETLVGDGFAGEGGDGDDGWLRTGGMAASQEARLKDVRTVDEAGNLGESGAEEEEIPDMEDDEDDEEAIIRDPARGGNTQAYDKPFRD
jgi:hypothetical protein